MVDQSVNPSGIDSTPPTVGVLLVDDQALLRDMLNEVLQRDPRFRVLGSVSSADEALAVAGRVRPDVILIDIEMPGSNCFEVARQIARILPKTRLIFLTGFAHDRYIEQALSVGARGYLTKNVSPGMIMEAVLKVAAGAFYFSEQVRARMVIDESGPRLMDERASPIAGLSAREFEVLRHIAMGLAKKEIAGKMHISVSTVENHTAKIMKKLKIHDRVELARFAIREKLVQA